MDISHKIRFFAIENAAKFNGKANSGTVIGKILAEFPEMKKDIASLSKQIQEIIKEVDSISPEEQKKEYEQTVPKEEQKEKKENRKEAKKESKKELPDLANAVMGKVITRIPPEPSKYNHIGHALSFLINYMYAKKYNGKCIIRFEDTNPEKATQEFVDAMIEDVVEYLDVKADKIIFVSDDMPIFYEMAEKLIMMKKAYVCTCDRETMQKLREEGKTCKCTKHSVEKILEEWKNMLAGKYEEGQAILRLSADMTSENHVMRDPVLFRINKTAHYRQKNKYFVWPMYDMENSIEDSITGVTHILRSSEFGSMRIELQDYVKDLLGLSKQTIIQYGRFNVSGATTKGREIREKIEAGDVSGWDDPSLVTLKALKRRGFLKETFYELVHEVGLSANTDKNLDWSLINSINRSLLDEKASRFFFIDEPIKIKVKDAPHMKAEMCLHPGHPELGLRELETKGEFYISKHDKDKFKEHDLIRLMDCLNFEVKGDEFIFHSKEHEHYKEKGSMIIHWLPASHNLVDVEIRMPDNEIKKGFAEEGVKKLNEGAIVQFTRFGFCRLDEKHDDKLVFWFTTK